METPDRYDLFINYAHAEDTEGSCRCKTRVWESIS